ncbi:MAG: hypothetical protein KGL39_26745, partial [Patescibacteria group bacterium]|nr:hypothetical protein [Patescibacteria group bacterium]
VNLGFAAGIRGNASLQAILYTPIVWLPNIGMNGSTQLLASLSVVPFGVIDKTEPVLKRIIATISGQPTDDPSMPVNMKINITRYPR